MNVYVVEYCDVIISIFSNRKKATDYVTNEVKRYMADFTHLENWKEWAKDYKKDYEIYKMKVE